LPISHKLIETGYGIDAAGTSGALVFHAATRLADDGWQTTIEMPEAMAAAKANPEGDSRVRISGAFVEIGGEPIVPVDSSGLKAVPKLFATFKGLDPHPMRISELSKLVRSKDPKPGIDGATYDRAKIESALRALRSLGVTTVNVDHIDFRRGNWDLSTLRLQADGVEVLINSTARSTYVD
jgi:hypothetical protein